MPLICSHYYSSIIIIIKINIMIDKQQQYIIPQQFHHHNHPPQLHVLIKTNYVKSYNHLHLNSFASWRTLFNSSSDSPMDFNFLSLSPSIFPSSHNWFGGENFPLSIANLVDSSRRFKFITLERHYVYVESNIDRLKFKYNFLYEIQFTCTTMTNNYYFSILFHIISQCL